MTIGCQRRSLSYITKSIKPNGIQTLTLNSKPVNALTPGLLHELKDELTTVRDSPDSVRGLILTSALPKVYSAGLDLKTLVAHDEYHLDGLDGTKSSPGQRQQYKQHIKNYMGLFSQVVKLLVTLPQPSVAAVRGFAPAGGTVLSLCCDYRIGSESGFTMGLNEVQVGMAPPLWVHRLMLNAIGPRKSILAVQRGQMFTQQECQDIGLIDKVVPDAQLLSSAEQELLSYLSLPPVARVDAKLKSVENVSSLFHENALDAVVDSISGPEFQTTVKGIIAKLSNKK